MAFPLPQAAPARRVRLPGARRRRERAYRRGRRERCPHRSGRGGLAATGGQAGRRIAAWPAPHRSEEHTSELQSLAYLVCRLLLEKKKKKSKIECIVHVIRSMSVAHWISIIRASI